jgi:ribonuclease Z
LIHEAILEQESEEISRAAYRVGNDRMGVVFHDIQNYHANLMDYEDQPGLLSRLEGIDIGMLALIHIIPDKDQPIVKRVLKRFKSASSHETVIVKDNMVMELPLNSDKIFIK